MQQLITVVAICLGVAALVYAESCTVNGDCSSTTCSTGNEIVCEHPAGAGVTTNGGLCTCGQVNLNCTTRADCLSLNLNDCADERKHCYDNRCICTRFPTGG